MFNIYNIFFKIYKNICNIIMGFLGDIDRKESACNAGDLGSIPGSGKIP